jgi:hypothetical protein
VGTPNDAAARSHYYQCVLAIDGDLTTIRIGPVTIAASGRAVDDNRPTTFLCTATARLTRPNPTMPAPRLHFTDLDHARRFAANTAGLWQADADPLSTPQTCQYRLVRERTTVTIAPGAPLYLADLEHLVHLAAYWSEVTPEQPQQSIENG